jgi:hypothetical protein
MTSQRQREEFDELLAAAKDVPAFVSIGDQRGQLLREELFSAAGGAQNSSFLKERAEVFGRDFERDGSASIWYMCCSVGVSAGSFLRQEQGRVRLSRQSMLQTVHTPRMWRSS